VQSGYTCAGATPSVCTATCGDGIKAGAELCDDNNLANGDCCSSDCKIEAGCEVEVNDASATANGFATLSVGGKINGFIRPVGDKDYYAFVVPPNGVGKITATTVDSFLGIACTSNTIDTYLTLYSASATSIATNDDVSSTTNYCSTLTASNLVPGTYYVEVKASSLATITTFAYTLQANFQFTVCGNGIIEAPEQCDGGPSCAADCTLIPMCGDGVINGNDVCDDGNVVSGDGCSSTCLFESGTNEVEKNNTQAQADANPVIIGDGQLVGSIGSGDKDIFKVTLAASSVVRFETFEGVTLDCPTIDLTMKLFDSTFTQQKIDVQGSSNASGINNCAALVLALPAGSYYVQLEKTTAGTVPRYAFQTKFSTSVGSEIEPNDTSATATPLAGTEMNVAGAHATGDLDWYAITVASNGLSVRAETIEETADTLVSSKNCENLNTDTTLTLFNAAATSLASDTDDGRGFCSAIDGTGATPRDAAAHNLAAGTYYLQVSSGSIYTYRLAVTLR
jgi:cysteine-rich repeat protein